VRHADTPPKKTPLRSFLTTTKRPSLGHSTNRLQQCNFRRTPLPQKFSNTAARARICLCFGYLFHGDAHHPTTSKWSRTFTNPNSKTTFQPTCLSLAITFKPIPTRNLLISAILRCFVPISAGLSTPFTFSNFIRPSLMIS